MNTIIMKVHKHDGSTRVTIPREIIKEHGWENEEYFVFIFDGDGMIGLQPISTSGPISLEALRRHEELSELKT